MKGLLKAALAVGGGAVGAELVRRTFFSGARPRYEPWERAPYRDFPNRVLILGGGFAGYTAAKTLCRKTRHRDDVGVMVISRENFFVFWPMLAGVISSDIDTKNVAQPLRRALIRDGASFRRAEVEGVNLEKQCVTADGREFPYEHLIVALGAEPAYFGIPGVEEHAISIRGIGAAEEIRNRVIERYEQTTLARGQVSDACLTFVVIGGGATGVEVASELHGLVHDILAPDYPNINPHRIKIISSTATSRSSRSSTRPAAHGPPEARRPADRGHQQRKGEGDNGREGDPLRRKGALDGERDLDRRRPREREAGRPRPPRRREEGPEGGRLHARRGPRERVGGGGLRGQRRGGRQAGPPNAQAATQEGKAVARNVLAAIDGRELEPFDYKPVGQLVEIGSDFAVNQVMNVKFSGFLASLFWRATYLYKLESPQSRARIAADWFLDLFFDPAVTQIRDRQ
jgi:NADH dehydrogenase